MSKKAKVQSPWPEESECGTCNNCWDCLIGDEYPNEYVAGVAGTGYCKCWHCEAFRNAPFDPEPFK